MSNDLAKRAAECSDQKIEGLAYQKFKTLLEPMKESDIHRTTLLTLSKMYYDNAAGEDPWSTHEKTFEAMSFVELKTITLSLCAEAINRDMIDYIRTSKRGNLGARMYRVLIPKKVVDSPIPPAN